MDLTSITIQRPGELTDGGKDFVGAEAGAAIDLRWHDLRHEAACRWRESGLDLREIQILLGHSSLLVTERYLNVSDDELADAMATKLWGKRGKR